MADDDAPASEDHPKPKTTEVPTAPSKMQVWFPAGVWLRKYDWGRNTTADLIAAVSVAALLIPESMGYASVAGVPAEVGLYAAPLALIGYALFGGSKLLVYAAAGSVAAVSGSVVSGLSGGDKDTAVAMTAALALTSGVVFLVAGLVRMGWVANFISKAVMAGFITGMAIQIIVGQFGKLFGVDAGDGDTFEKLWTVASDVGDWNWTATALGVGAVLLIFAIQRFIPKLPAALTAVVLASVFVAMADPNIDIVAEIPEGLPTFSVPSGISGSDWLTLVLGGAVVALVGFSEGWGASSVISKQTHDDLTTNQEFRAYGFGSMGAGILGGMPVTGSLSKSSAAMTAGAKTQMSNVFLAAIVLLTLLVLAPAFQWLPETVLAAVVITAMWGSASPAKLIRLWRIDKVDFTLGVLTFLVVLGFDLLPAMITGIVASILYLVYRASFPGTGRARARRRDRRLRDNPLGVRPHQGHRRQRCPQGSRHRRVSVQCATDLLELRRVREGRPEPADRGRGEGRSPDHVGDRLRSDDARRQHRRRCNDLDVQVCAALRRRTGARPSPHRCQEAPRGHRRPRRDRRRTHRRHGPSCRRPGHREELSDPTAPLGHPFGGCAAR